MVARAEEQSATEIAAQAAPHREAELPAPLPHPITPPPAFRGRRSHNELSTHDMLRGNVRDLQRRDATRAWMAFSPNDRASDLAGILLASLLQRVLGTKA